MSARMAPATAPLPADVQELIDRIVPEGTPPFALFTTMARDPRLFMRFAGRGLMGKGNLSMRQREIIVDRVTAQCGSEYEWGLHMAYFGEKLFDEAQAYSLVHGGPDDPCWPEEDRILIRFCDSLHTTCTLDDDLYADVKTILSDEAILEALMLAGNYRTVAYITESLKLPLEDFGRRFPARIDKNGEGEEK